jgi:hypothetical protein
MQTRLVNGFHVVVLPPGSPPDDAIVAGGILAGHSFGELFIPQGVPPQD